MRLLELKKLTEHCTVDSIFVTAFLDRNTFRQFAPDIAWETEVWIADAPDHLTKLAEFPIPGTGGDG
ncbi:MULTISPECIES: BsuBI/PstI family type II restriction endonuclease [unclassified Moorena]|uniref:BsuBI/PstI family type II restriction endonuclease n=1 Tax=unclassified Moorena TaxID=2683338 RepID=UPI0025E278CD|nr:MULTISPECIES: BsuBI/PstI family type II restriction endonuclease [unclassified Moorena]